MSAPAIVVSRVCEDPLPFITQTSMLPLRLVVNRIRPQGVACEKVAVTDRGWLIVTWQTPLPGQAPVHPAKNHPSGAWAPRVTMRG